MVARLGVWLALATGCSDSKPPVSAVPPRHVLLILVDTLRADVVAEVQTPHIDALAARGAAVDRAWSSGTWTVPSVVSLFTGMSVRQHGWNRSTGRIGRYPPLPDAPTLAKVLRDAGFSTTGLYTNPYLADALGFDRGFDTWRRTVDTAVVKQLEKDVLPELGDGRRHFIYVHLLGPHSPLRPAADAQQRYGLDASWFESKQGFGIGRAKRDQPPGARAAYAQAYRAVVEETDARIGEILAVLAPHRDDTLVILTSDHGELLGEHERVGHGRHVWEPLTHVPLIVSPCDSIAATLTIASIPALITDRLQVPYTWPTAPDAALPLVSEREGQLALSTDGHHKGIWDENSLSFYDLVADPEETHPLPPPAALADARATWERSVPQGHLPTDSVAFPAETVQELEALGYAAQ